MVALCAAALAGTITSAPLTVILDRFMPDDAFYFYKPAQNFVTSGFVSFDGLHPTNGFQPLWFAMCVPVFQLVPGGGELPVRLLLLVQLALYAGATALLFRVLAVRFGPASAGVALLAWLITTHRLGVNGLETAVLMATWVALLSIWSTGFVGAGADVTLGRCAILGTAVAVVFLARTDSAFLVPSIGLALVARRPRDRRRLLELLSFGAPIALLGGGYLLLNVTTTGHLMPVSGAAKQYHSALLRDAAIAAQGGVLPAVLENLAWPFSTPGNRLTAFGLLAPWALVGASFVWPRSQALRAVRGFWPFFAGCAASFLFYGLAFHGSFSRTSWYYAPHAACGVLSIAAVAAWWSERPLSGRLVLAFTLIGWALDWPPSGYALVLGVAVIAVVEIGARLGRRRAAFGWIAIALVGLLAVSRLELGSKHQEIEMWWALGLGAFGIHALLASSAGFRPGGLIPWIPVACATTVIGLLNLRTETAAPPSNWNYNLYLGAIWARDHLPEDATIWSGSTGILGYFSERTCVNTDGLINSHDFLENVLVTGRVSDYVRQWDYAIDAFSGRGPVPTVSEGALRPAATGAGRAPLSGR